VGGDLKYGSRRDSRLTLPTTQIRSVEADAQQLNLTRFNLFFPEKREFFLEGAGIFAFGGASSTAPARTTVVDGDVPVLFFSRRIGLNESGEACLFWAVAA